MWTSSISRIALTTSLAVAGGLSLVGVLISLPEQGPGPVPAASGRSAALDSPQPDQAATARQSPELARAIDRVEAVLSGGPSAAPASVLAQAEPAPADAAASGEPWSGLLKPDELAAIAPAAGRPGPSSNTAPQQDASAASLQEMAQIPLPGDAGADRGTVPGPYIASTIHAGSQTASAKSAEPQPAAQQMAALPAASARAGAGFVIIGSFRHNENAARHVKDHVNWLPQILTKEVAGTLQYRVAIGPFQAADLRAAQQRIIASGIADAWLLPQGKGAAEALIQTLDILG